MKENSIHKFHIFLPWEDEKQEQWLAGMSRKGLHLKEPGPLGRFLFSQGTGKEYSYRLDYNRNKPAEEYLQILRDAGWEYLGTMAGWHYWRKEIKAGQSAELFTDQESKVQKYQRMLTFYGTSTPGAAVLFIAFAAVFKQYPGRHPLWVVILLLGTCLGILLFAGISVLMIQLRINKIKQS